MNLNRLPYSQLIAKHDNLRRIRFWLGLFIVGLILSGITAFPLQSELGWLISLLNADSCLQSTAFSFWTEISFRLPLLRM